jgi:hypothetical protein
MSNHDRENPPAAGGDSALDRAWQQASNEQPAPQLDAAILAAARKSVQQGARHDPHVRARARSWNWLARWQPLAAAAAVAGLAFVLVQSLPREASKPAPAAATDAVSARESRATGAEEPARLESSTAGPTASTLVPPAPDPASATASEYDVEAGADRTRALRMLEAEQRNVVSSKRATGVAAPEVTTAAASESMQADAAPPSTAERAASIATLFAAGEFTGAADALRAFRAADPQADTYLPESLRDWARTVR